MVFDPMHFLPLLEQKVGALDQAAPLQGWDLPEAFATLHRLLEARMPHDRHAERAGVGEVRQRHAARLGRLPEDHIALGPMQRAPVADPALEGSAHAVVREDVRIRHLQVPQQRDRLHGRVALQDREQHGAPDRFERIRNGAAAGGLALRWLPWIGIEAPGGAFAEPCPGGGCTLAVMKSVGHVDPRLLVGDGFARHDLISAWFQRSRPYRPAAASTHTIPQKEDRTGDPSLRSGYARPPPGATGQLG